MNDAGVAPPGVTPIQQPIKQARSDVIQYFGNVFHVCQTIFGSIFARVPLNESPSSIVSRISPNPNRPITAIRKSNPWSNCVEPNVIRSVPVTVSRPTAASANPSIIDTIVLAGGSRPMPTKLQKEIGRAHV